MIRGVVWQSLSDWFSPISLFSGWICFNMVFGKGGETLKVEPCLKDNIWAAYGKFLAMRSMLLCHDLHQSGNLDLHDCFWWLDVLIQLLVFVLYCWMLIINCTPLILVQMAAFFTHDWGKMVEVQMRWAPQIWACLLTMNKQLKSGTPFIWKEWRDTVYLLLLFLSSQ